MLCECMKKPWQYITHLKDIIMSTKHERLPLQVSSHEAQIWFTFIIFIWGNSFAHAIYSLADLHLQHCRSSQKMKSVGKEAKFGENGASKTELSFYNVVVCSECSSASLGMIIYDKSLIDGEFLFARVIFARPF